MDLDSSWSISRGKKRQSQSMRSTSNANFRARRCQVTFTKRSMRRAPPICLLTCYLSRIDRATSQRALTLDACVTTPNAPHLIFVGRLSVVGIHRSGQCAGGPTELHALFRVPSLENTVQQPSHKAVAATDPVEDADLARFDDVEGVALRKQSRPSGADWRSRLLAKSLRTKKHLNIPLSRA